jgi:hypothetical protein
MQHNYIHKVAIIMHENIQRESHKIYGSPTSVTWLQVLSKQRVLAIPPLWLQKHTDLHALSRFVASAYAR